MENVDNTLKFLKEKIISLTEQEKRLTHDNNTLKKENEELVHKINSLPSYLEKLPKNIEKNKVQVAILENEIQNLAKTLEEEKKAQKRITDDIKKEDEM